MKNEMLALKDKTMLGDVPDDWEIVPLKGLILNHFAGDWGSEGNEESTKVIRSTNLTNDGSLNLQNVAMRSLKGDKAKNLSPKEGDILLERSGGGPDQPVGRVGFINQDMPGYAFSNFLHLLRPDQTIVEPRFLGWILFRINTTGRVLRLEHQTTGIRNLHFRHYMKMPVPLPIIEEQKAIARILDSVDTAIERTREAIDSANLLQKSLLQKFLFEALGETAYADRPKRPLPAGWKLKPTGKLLQSDPKNGKSPKTNSQPPGIPTFSIAAIRNGHVDLEDLTHRKYAQISVKEAEPYLVSKGDVLIVRGNANPELVGKAGIIQSHPAGCIYPDITKRVIFKAHMAF
jgi:type I restriction enzyme S subunit